MREFEGRTKSARVRLVGQRGGTPASEDAVAHRAPTPRRQSSKLRIFIVPIRPRLAWYDPFNHAIYWRCRHWLREPPDE
jgi:hypothetical protein